MKLKPDKPRKFAPVDFGDSSKLRVGDSVLAMGSPMALSQSVTLGIISNTEMIMPRMFGQARFKLDGEDVGSLVRWIGHDAAIYGGNSGGPLVNLRGEIIGINEISFGLSGAIPGNLAQSVAGADHRPRQGAAGAGWAWTCSRCSSTRPDEHGVLVSGVVDDAPAAKAGLEGRRPPAPNVDGRPTNVRFDEQMPDFMGAGDRACPSAKRSTRWRGGTGRTSTLRLVPMERDETFSPSRRNSSNGADRA